MFKTYKDKKSSSMWERILKITWSRDKIDDFNNEEEKIIKKWVEKRKKKEARGSWKKVLKRQKKAEKEKIEETELWQQLKL